MANEGFEAARQPAADPSTFDPTDRAHLLRLPQIGPKVIDRLEAAGFSSLETMRRAGLEAVVASVCHQVGSRAWSNRRRALARAFDAPLAPPASGGACGASDHPQRRSASAEPEYH